MFLLDKILNEKSDDMRPLEGDDEEEFWENEFRRTIIQPESGALNGTCSYPFPGIHFI